MGHSQTHPPTHDSVTLDCIRKLVLEMTRYLRKTELAASSEFYQRLLSLRSIHEIEESGVPLRGAERGAVRGDGIGAGGAIRAE